LWISLPSLVVKAPSRNCFKTRLDKFWSNQDVVVVVVEFMTLKHRSWEPEVEVILSVIVSFIVLRT